MQQRIEPHPISVRPVILVVDDDPDLLFIFGTAVRAMVQQLGVAYPVHVFAQADAALAALPQYPVAVLIVDYSMPIMDGLQLATALKAMTPTTKVILMTAYSQSVAHLVDTTDVIDYYLAKPIAYDELRDMLREALALPQAAAQHNADA